ncbi:MAG: polynucleotide adenylyltransferase PcnB, partial [Burkholderiales bacterium]
ESPPAADVVAGSGPTALDQVAAQDPADDASATDAPRKRRRRRRSSAPKNEAPPDQGTGG